MFDYLINYGVNKFENKFQDIDINDRLLLQDQINTARKNYNDLLLLLDDVNNKSLTCNEKMSKRTKELIQQNGGVKNNAIFDDEEYMQLDAEAQALKVGINMIRNQIEFVQTDLRILNSVFYNKY